MRLYPILFSPLLGFLLAPAPATHAQSAASSSSPLSFRPRSAPPSSLPRPHADYLRRAEEVYHQVWNEFRVPQYGLFSEYYPQQHPDSLNYMEGKPVASRKVSFLWPFSGIFSATNMLMQVPGRQKAYRAYLDSATAAMEKYRDTTRKPIGYQAYPPEFEKADRYYDDNGLVALDYTWAYRNTRDRRYLQRAEETFRFILSGWSAQLGGGVTWLEGHDDQKPACSNGMATLAALKLYEVTKNRYYLQKGLRFYHWMHDHLLDSNGLYANDVKTKDGQVNHTYYTYNTGSMLEASVLLYRFTHQPVYLKAARDLAAASVKIPLDMPWFVLVLFRGYDALYRVDGDPAYINIIKAAVDRGLPDKTSAHGAQWLLTASCMAEFYARLALLP